MNKYILSYISPMSEGRWCNTAEIMAPSRRKAVKIAKDMYSDILDYYQWRVTRSDK